MRVAGWGAAARFAFYVTLGVARCAARYAALCFTLAASETRKPFFLLRKAEAHDARFMRLVVERRHRNGRDADFTREPLREVGLGQIADRRIIDALEIRARARQQ